MARPFIERPPRFGIRKPSQHRADVDRSASLSRGLVSCVAFDICMLAGSVRDFASAAQRFTWLNSGQSQISSPYGGGAALTPGSSGNALMYGSPLPSSAVWSASYMTKFDGGPANTPLDAPFCNNGPTVGIALSSASNQYVDLATSSFLWTPPVTTFTTWARHTWTSDGTTVAFYSNGVFQSSNPVTINFSLGAIVGGWPRGTSDFFFWNRTLTARDVANHNAAPFSVLKPRYSERWWLTNGTCPPQRQFCGDFSQDFGPFISSCGGSKPGLLTTGVGS